MAFNLGNFAVKEIIFGIAQEQGNQGKLVYTLDQLSSTEISVESDSTDITDKNGNVIRTIYKSKTASLSATSALISPVLMNANSGVDMAIASADAALAMPKVITVKAGSKVALPDLTETNVPTVRAIGKFANGANGKSLLMGTGAIVNYELGLFKLEKNAEGVYEITVPEVSATEGERPTSYVVMYDRFVEGGYALANTSASFPKTVALTLYAAIVDPCTDTYKAAYIVIPSFTPNPATTISLSSDSQEMTFEGKINTTYCDDCSVLYYIYFPDENAVLSGECSGDDLFATRPEGEIVPPTPGTYSPNWEASDLTTTFADGTEVIDRIAVVDTAADTDAKKMAWIIALAEARLIVLTKTEADGLTELANEFATLS